METTNYAALCLMEHQILQHVKDALRITLGWDTRSVGVARKVSSVQFTRCSGRQHSTRVMGLEEEDGYMTSVRELRAESLRPGGELAARTSGIQPGHSNPDAHR